MATPDAERDSWFRALGKDKDTSDKSWNVAFILAVVAGWAGADRLYLGSAWLGIFKFCTLGGFGVWWLIDMILLLSGEMKDGEGRNIGGPNGGK